jgi:hypothetical protein
MSFISLLGRVVTYSLERHWIDFIGFLMESLPGVDKNSWISRLGYITFVSLILLAATEIFETMGTQHQQKERARLERQLFLLKQK